MTRKQTRTLVEVLRVNLIAAVGTLLTFLVLFAALDAMPWLDPEVVLVIIAAGLVVARLVDAYSAPKRRAVR